MTETYEYEGNTFTLKEERMWYTNQKQYTITGIKVKTRVLYLPDKFREAPVTRWITGKQGIKGGDQAAVLWIPKRITRVRLYNSSFPNLDRVEVDSRNLEFSANKTMLLSKDGQQVIYGLAEGNRKRAVIPEYIKKIGDMAFACTSCSEIVFENPDVETDMDSFQNSKWLRSQGTYAIVGNTFYRLLRPVRELRVPKEIQRFHSHAFCGNVPKHLITPVLPMGKSREYLLWEEEASEQERGCREITFLSGGPALDLFSLKGLKGIEAVHIEPGNRMYCSEGGVIFSKDKQVLEYYPPEKQDTVYTIPDTVTEIARRAFAENRYLQELVVPDSVVSIGTGAFFGCSALERIRFSDKKNCVMGTFQI